MRERDRWGLVGGRVVDVRTGAYHPNGTVVVVEGDRIVGVGEGEVVRTVDVEGRAVVPGLLSTHGHLMLVTPSLSLGLWDLLITNKLRAKQIEKSLADCIDRGITNIQDSLSFTLEPNRKLVKKIGGGEIPGPRIHQAVHVSPRGGAHAPAKTLKGRLMRAMAGISEADYESRESGIVIFDPGATEQEVRDAVDRAIDERGADHVIKLYDQKEQNMSYRSGATLMTGEQMAAAADQARKRGLRSSMHHVTVESFRRGVEAGVDSLVHIPIDGPLEERDVRSFLEAGCTIEPTLTIAYCYSWDLEGHACHGHPKTRELTRRRERSMRDMIERDWLPSLRAVLRDGFRKAAAGEMRLAGMDVSHIFRYFSGYVTHGMDNLRLLWQGGGGDRVSCSNDAGAVFCSHASIPTEMEMLDLCLNGGGERLMSPADALRVATMNGARALGLDDYGAIEEGKVADLAVLDGDPLEDLGLIGRPVAALFMEGRLVVDRCGLGDQP